MVGVNQQNMSGTNRFLLLKNIATRGPVSRVDLSKRTGLSKMTVTTLVGEYLQSGIIRECGTSETQTGRKPILLEAVPESLLTLGVHIGRDFIMAGIVDLCGNVRSFEHIPLPQILSRESLISGVLLLCERSLASVEQRRVWGIGVSSIGPLDVKNGTIVNPPDFNGIEDVPIVDALAEKYPLPVYMENDMCVSALAELYFGKGKDYDRFVYMGVSAGVGGGIVLDRKLYRGSRGLAAVLGHLTVVPGGLPCECGSRGCLEVYGSVRAALRTARELGAREDLTWSLLLESARQGDPICLEALDNMYHYLELALLNVANTLDVDCIFLGGDIWCASEFFVDRLNDALRAKVFGRRVGEPISVRLSQFSANAAFIGTAALVMENNLRMEL